MKGIQMVPILYLPGNLVHLSFCPVKCLSSLFYVQFILRPHLSRPLSPGRWFVQYYILRVNFMPTLNAYGQ